MLLKKQMVSVWLLHEQQLCWVFGGDFI